MGDIFVELSQAIFVARDDRKVDGENYSKGIVGCFLSNTSKQVKSDEVEVVDLISDEESCKKRRKKKQKMCTMKRRRKRKALLLKWNQLPRWIRLQRNVMLKFDCLPLHWQRQINLMGVTIPGEKEDVFRKEEEGNEETDLDIPVGQEHSNKIMDEKLNVGGNNDEEEEEEKQECENDYSANIPVQARCMLCNTDRDEFVPSRKDFENWLCFPERAMFVASTIVGKLQGMLVQTIASNPRVTMNYMVSCNVPYLKPLILIWYATLN